MAQNVKLLKRQGMVVIEDNVAHLKILKRQVTPFGHGQSIYIPSIPNRVLYA